MGQPVRVFVRWCQPPAAGSQGRIQNYIDRLEAHFGIEILHKKRCGRIDVARTPAVYRSPYTAYYEFSLLEHAPGAFWNCRQCGYRMYCSADGWGKDFCSDDCSNTYWELRLQEQEEAQAEREAMQEARSTLKTLRRILSDPEFAKQQQAEYRKANQISGQLPALHSSTQKQRAK